MRACEAFPVRDLSTLILRYPQQETGFGQAVACILVNNGATGSRRPAGSRVRGFLRHDGRF
jgi:hypothetical protein